MDKKYGIAAIVTMLIAAGYILYTDVLSPKVAAPLATELTEPSLPEESVPTETDSTDDVPRALSPSVLKTQEKSDDTQSDLTIGYKNEDMGFEFEYPAKYGALQLKYYPNKNAPIEDTIMSFPMLPGVTIQNQGYDSGTDTPKEPVCPDKAVCVRKVNKVGTEFFETTLIFMGGEILRKEFPISAVTSLVIEYSIDPLSVSEKAELDTLADSVIIQE